MKEQDSRKSKAPEKWLFWQKKAGNEFANDLYQRGEYLNALTIYQSLATLTDSPDWQWPVIYQMGLCFEKLRVDRRAAEAYKYIIDESKKPERKLAELPDSVRGLVEMAQWRGEQLVWKSGTEVAPRPRARPRTGRADGGQQNHSISLDSMISPMTLLESLQTHTEACEEMYRLMLELNRTLKTGTANSGRRAARPANGRARHAREFPRRAEDRPAKAAAARPPSNAAAMEKCQRTILKALLLDRENEQLLLKNAMVRPPAAPSVRPAPGASGPDLREAPLMD